jgi:cysteinyl-tRNA synthetase
LDYRYFLLGGHYRSQLQFSWESLAGAKNARKSLLDRIKTLAEKAGALPPAASGNDGGAGAYREAFNKALEEDLSTPRALAELWGLLRDNSLEPAAILAVVFDMDQALGLSLREAAALEKGPEDEALAREIETLIAERKEAKNVRDYARADHIRQTLKDRGIILEDGPEGTIWRRIKL